MAYLLFVDESGQDHGRSPYEVLAGVSVHDAQLWDLIQDLKVAERLFFGTRVTLGTDELKAKRLLKAKTFRLAAQMPAFELSERTRLAEEMLIDGQNPSRRKLTALAQAKVEYCKYVLRQCASHGVRFFATIVVPDSPRPAGRMLRKDYAYLFERFYNFIDEQQEHERGLVVFDELDRSRSHVLSDQMSAYFAQTQTGRRRAARLIPEPFFVHSELTTGIQLADLVAYVVSWNVRVGAMVRPARSELNDLGQLVLEGRHKAIVPRSGYPNGFYVWSFAYIDDLRPREETDQDDDFARAFSRALDENLGALGV